MSQENVEIVRRVGERLNSGDVDGVLQFCTPDVEFDASRALGPLHGTYDGLDQARQAFEEFFGPWESFRIELDELIDAGEDVVASGVGYFRGRDGIEVRARAAWVWTIRDGAIARMCFYQERREALEAAGLSE